MENVTDRRGFLAAAATAAGATGIIATPRPAKAQLSAIQFQVVTLTDREPDFVQDLEGHLANGWASLGYSVDQGHQYVLLVKQIA